MRNDLKTVLILGANSDVAKECIKLYLQKSYAVIAASRDLASLEKYVEKNTLDRERLSLQYFNATDFPSHQNFYQNLPVKPSIVIYAAGFLVENKLALQDFPKTQQMIETNYLGAVSILNIIAMDPANLKLERVIGLSSLSGVRGRKSNFVYGSSKAAFTQYLAGLRQELYARKIIVNVLILGYINSKINAGLELNKSLIMQPDYVAGFIVNSGDSFVIVPNFKWKIIYGILKLLPERWVAKLP